MFSFVLPFLNSFIDVFSFQFFAVELLEEHH